MDDERDYDYLAPEVVEARDTAALDIAAIAHKNHQYILDHPDG